MKNTLGVLLALVAVVAAVEGFFLVQVNQRIDSLEARLEGSGDSPAVSPLALGGEVRELEERQKDTASGVEAVQLRVATLAERVDGMDRRAKETSALARAEGRGGPTSEELREVVRATVAETVDRKLEAMPKGGGGDWKPSMAELGEYLALSGAQSDKAARIIDDAKHEAFQLLTLRRVDGTTKMDDFVAAMTKTDGKEKAVQALFASLFTEKIPGREEPYITEILRITTGAQKTLGAVLDEEQGKKLSRVKIDYLGVKTDYDPFAEYVKESLR